MSVFQDLHGQTVLRRDGGHVANTYIVYIHKDNTCIEYICIYMSSVAFSYFGSNARKIPKIPTHTRETKYLQPQVSTPSGYGVDQN